MEHAHYILHKPHGFLSQFVYNGKRKKRKRLLGELYDFAPGTMSVGRLDEDSEGLLLLTTDGKQSQLVRSKKVEKEYYAQVDGKITRDALEQMAAGVNIGIRGEKYKTLPCTVEQIDDPQFAARAKKIRDERHGSTSWISITVTEGKYRQVRKMTAAVGFPTLRLVRMRIHNITLGDLEPGAVAEVDRFIKYPEEVTN